MTRLGIIISLEKSIAMIYPFNCKVCVRNFKPNRHFGRRKTLLGLIEIVLIEMEIIQIVNYTQTISRFYLYKLRGSQCTETGKKYEKLNLSA